MMNRIAYYRKRHSLTQKDFAEIVGISASAVAMYETDRRTPNVFLAQRMSRILDVHINSLFSEGTFPSETDDNDRNSIH